MNLILLILLILLLFPAFGVFAVGVSLGYLLKILLAFVIIVLIVNLAQGRRNFW